MANLIMEINSIGILKEVEIDIIHEIGILMELEQKDNHIDWESRVETYQKLLDAACSLKDIAIE